MPKFSIGCEYHKKHISTSINTPPLFIRATPSIINSPSAGNFVKTHTNKIDRSLLVFLGVMVLFILNLLHISSTHTNTTDSPPILFLRVIVLSILNHLLISSTHTLTQLLSLHLCSYKLYHWLFILHQLLNTSTHTNAIDKLPLLFLWLIRLKIYTPSQLPSPHLKIYTPRQPPSPPTHATNNLSLGVNI